MALKVKDDGDIVLDTSEGKGKNGYDPSMSGTGRFILDESGKIVDSVKATDYNEGQQLYSYVKDGDRVWVNRKEDIPTWVELNKDTGDIKVSAPDVVLNSDMYKNKMKPLLTQLSQAYKTQPDYKMPNPLDADDEKQDYTIEEIVRKIQDGINLNQMALGNYYRAQDWFTGVFGEDASDKYTPTRHYILAANGLSGKDDALISIPKSVIGNSIFNFLGDAASYKDNTMTVKDFKELFYHNDFFRDMFGNNGPSQLKNLVRSELTKMQNMDINEMSDDQIDEYMRLQAFNTYLNGAEPRKDVINSFAEQVWGTGEGILRGTADLTSGLVSVADGLYNRVFGLEEGSLAMERYGNPLSRDITMAANIGANIISVPTGNGFIDYNDMLTTDHVSTELRKQYDERSQFYVDTNADAATWFMIGYAGTKVAETMIMGKAVSSVALGAAARAAGIAGIDATEQAFASAMGLETLPEGVKTGRELMNYAITGTETPNMFQLISGLSKINPTDVAQMSQFVIKTAAESQNAEALASAVLGAAKTAKTLSTVGKITSIADLTVQTFIDASLQDPVVTKKLIEGAGNEDERRILWESAAWNAGGYAAGLLLGKMIAAFPKSAAGQAANESATRNMWGFCGWASAERDAVKEFFLGEGWMDKIKNPGKRQVALYKKAIQAAGNAIAKSGGDVASTISDAGYSTKESIRHFVAVQDAVAQREAGVSTKISEYMSEAHPAINENMTNLHDVSTKLTKMIEDSEYKFEPGTKTLIGGVDASMGWPQEVNNYVGIYVQKRILDNKIAPKMTVLPSGLKAEMPRGILTPSQKNAYVKYTETLAKYEEMLPKNITEYIKSDYVPALYKAGSSIRNYRMSPKASLDIKEEIEGYISTGMWGEDGSEYAPMMRITEAKKQFEEESRGLSQTVKTGFIKNRSSNPEAIQWGSNADFINPTLAMQRYLTATAMDEINQTLLRENLKTPGVKNVTLFDGTKTGAARTYENLEPALDKAIKDGIHGIPAVFDMEYIADKVLANYKIEQAAANATKEQAKATEKMEKIITETPKISNSDRAMAITTMPADDVESILKDAKIQTVQDVMGDEASWNEFVKGSSKKVRDEIKNQIDMYSNYTGSRISTEPTESGLAGADDAIEALERDEGLLSYQTFKTTADINPSAYEAVNRAILKSNKDLVQNSEKIAKVAEEQKRAKLGFDASVRLAEANKAVNLPALNSRVEYIETIDKAIDSFYNTIINDENAVKVIDAIMYKATGVDKDVAREYVAMYYLNKNKGEVEKAAKDVYKHGKFKNEIGKMPGTKIDHIESEMVKEIDSRITERLNDARYAYTSAGGEAIDNDKVLKDIHQLMDEIEQTGHKANVVALRQNGEELLVETDPFVADLANYHVIDTTSTAEKVLTNPVFKGMNRMARFFQTTLSPKSLRNQYLRDPGNAFFGVGARPILDGMKHVSPELAAKYGEEVVKQYAEMYPDDYKVLAERAKADNADVTNYVFKSIFAYGESTSPAMTQTAFYRDPFISSDKSENFWGQLEKTKSALGKAINKMGEFVETPHQAREVYLRNLTYSKGLKDGLDAGMSLEDAMNQARFFRDNGTTNFRHQLYHFRALAGSVNYFGAGINGYTSFWRLFSIDPVGMSCRIFGGLVVPIIVATAWSLATEENRERYKGLKEYEKNEQFVFVMNGQVYKIPIPQEFATFINPIRHAVESLYGANKHSFWELLMTDALNAGPIDFGDLMDLDRNEFAGDPTILDRMGQLGLSLIDQTMPLALKTIFSFATGIDTYTGQPIDTSYYSFDDEGNRILVGGTQSEFSIALGKFTGWSPSVIAWTTKSLFGTVGRDILDAVVASDPTRPITNTIDDMSLSAADYNRTATDWNRTMSDLWAEKEEKYIKEYNDYTDQINRESDPDKKTALKNKRKDAIAPFLQKVKTAVTTLNSKYPGMYDNYRFSAVVSLLTFDNGVASGDDAAARKRDQENFYQNRNRAYQWMQDLGISGGSEDSILGHLERDKDGNVVVKINTPLEILSAQSAFYDAKDIHVANIQNIIETGENSIKSQHKSIGEQISQIYAKGKLSQSDYNKIDDLKIEYDKKVMEALAPYIQRMTPEAAINNTEVIEYLKKYLYVPDAFKVNNRGYHVTNKSLNYFGSAEDAFAENFIKYIFGVNDNKYTNSWNFSGRKTLGGQ